MSSIDVLFVKNKGRSYINTLSNNKGKSWIDVRPVRKKNNNKKQKKKKKKKSKQTDIKVSTFCRSEKII